MYGSDVGFAKLTLQLSMLPDIDHSMQDLEWIHVFKDNAKWIRQIATHLPNRLTSATAERTFSTLRWLKSYLWSTMSRVVGRGVAGAAMATPLFGLPFFNEYLASNAQQVFLKDCCRHSWRLYVHYMSYQTNMQCWVMTNSWTLK